MARPHGADEELSRRVRRLLRRRLPLGPGTLQGRVPRRRSRPRSRAGSTRSATKRCRASAITRWASTRRPWPITRPPWNSTRPFPRGCPRSSFSRSVPTPAGRSRPPGRSAGCKPRWASCPYTMSSSRGRSTPRQQVAAGRGRPAAQPVSHRAARDRALHGAWPSAAAASCSDRWPPTIR